jgi:RNA polymerase sigma-70 factor (ECF subfamily)
MASRALTLDPQRVNTSREEPSKTREPLPDRALDLDLVARAAGGDAGAFRDLVARHQRKASAVAFGIVRNPEDAREVVQDAFVRVYKHLGDFAGQASFSTWLYRIVVNLAIDALRRRNPGQHLELDDHTALEGAPQELLPFRGEGDPFATLDRARLVEHMQAALDALPTYHRTVILLREVEGMSYEEIATTMGISKGTVMSRLFHARRKMQKLLRERLGDEVPAPQDDPDGGPPEP